MYSLLCTIFTWSGFHKFTNTHSHSTPLKWSTLSQTKAKQVVVLCAAKSFQVNKVTEDIQDIPGVDAIMVLASFLKSMICALESRFCFTSTKKTIAMDCTQHSDVSVHLSRDNLQMANRRPLLVVWPKKSSPHVMPQCLSCAPPTTTSVFFSFSSLRFWSWLHLPLSSRLAPPPLQHQDGTFRSQFLLYGMQTISATGRYIVYLKSPLPLFTFFSLSFVIICLWNDT